MTVKKGVEALCILRTRPYDLILADVHMPEMNGFQLHNHIKREFKLPVVLISADDKAEVVSNGMINGAAAFLVKPFKCEDLRNLWQFSVWWQKFKNPTILHEIGLITRDQYDSLILTNRPTRGGVYRRKNNKNNNVDVVGHIGTSSAATVATGVPDTPKASKTSKLVWTTNLHTRFVEAILVIGYHKAIPSTILEVMNVPGVTREQVASHLQKYRKFLQRVLDDKTDMDCSDWIDSSHISGNPNRVLLEQLRNEAANRHLENLIQQQDNYVPLTEAPSSSILKHPASTIELTSSSSEFNAFPPFIEGVSGVSTSGTKNTIKEMPMQQALVSSQGKDLVIGSNTVTNYGYSSNVAAGDFNGVTFPYTYTEHVGSISNASSVGQNLNCFDVLNNQMTNYNQISAAQQNYFSGEVSKKADAFTSINHVGPSISPYSVRLYSQQPFNGDVQRKMDFGENNIQPFGDQQISNIGSSSAANHFRVSLAINQQVDDFGSKRALADDYLPEFNPNIYLNQDENDKDKVNF